MKPTATYDDKDNLVWEYSRFPSGHKTVEDDVVEACGDWVGTCLYFPYYDDRNTYENFDYHGHSFKEVIITLLKGDNAKHMSLEGFEEYYGETEINLFNKVKEKILKEESYEG